MAIIYEPRQKRAKPKAKTASVLAAEKALRDTLARVGYKGGVKSSGRLDTSYLKVDRTVKTSDTVPANGNSKQAQKYTGDEIAGVALLHKQNYEPIRRDNKQAAVDAAQMRRN